MDSFSGHCYVELESFTCLMCGETCITSRNLLRSKILRKLVGEDQPLNLKSAVDSSNLPPCFDNLLPQVHRTNYRLAIYKPPDKPIVEAPKLFDKKQGWIKNEEGLVEPIWSTESIIST